MTGTNNIRFWDEAVRAFSFLVTRFGFDGPSRAHLGTEWAVEYAKGPSRLRVVMDAGKEPWVEIFQPVTETLVPKGRDASTAGTQPARRKHGLPGTSAHGAEWPRGMPDYLNALGRQVLDAEMEFLSSDPYAALAAELCAELQPILHAERAAGNVIENVAALAYERCMLEVILRKPLALSFESSSAPVGLTVHHNGDPHYPVGTSVSCPLHQHTLTGLDPYPGGSVPPKIDG